MTTEQVCRFDGCDNPSHMKGLCRAHYIQQWKGKPLQPLKEYNKRPVAPEGYAFCNDCKTFKSLDDFYMRQGKPISRCKPCFIKRQVLINNAGKEAA